MTGVRDPLFVGVTSQTFRRQLVASLAGGKIAALRVPDAVPSETCQALVERLQHIDDAYDEQHVFPRVAKIGPAINEFRRDGQIIPEYWEAVESCSKTWQSINFGPDPFGIARELLAAEWAGKVSVGRRGSLEMSAGIIREINFGLQVHFDDVAREQPDNLLDSNLVAQFAFNLYLAVPAEGGELVLWRHRWQPSDEASQIPGGYGYREAVVDSDQSLVFSPQVGEAILFDPRNYHTVRPCRGGRRVSLAFFVGLSDDGELLTWS